MEGAHLSHIQVLLREERQRSPNFIVMVNLSF